MLQPHLAFPLPSSHGNVEKYHLPSRWPSSSSPVFFPVLDPQTKPNPYQPGSFPRPSSSRACGTTITTAQQPTDQETRNPNPDSERDLATDRMREAPAAVLLSTWSLDHQREWTMSGAGRDTLPFAGLHQTPGLPLEPCQLGRWSCHAMSSRSGWGNPSISVLLGFDSSLPTLEPLSISQPSVPTELATYGQEQQTSTDINQRSHVRPLASSVQHKQSYRPASPLARAGKV